MIFYFFVKCFCTIIFIPFNGPKWPYVCWCAIKKLFTHIVCCGPGTWPSLPGPVSERSISPFLNCQQFYTFSCTLSNLWTFLTVVFAAIVCDCIQLKNSRSWRRTTSCWRAKTCVFEASLTTPVCTRQILYVCDIHCVSNKKKANLLNVLQQNSYNVM